MDVSSYQGEIDWQTLTSQGISFAFIKATEGSGYQDEYFSANWENARKTSLRVGAYHFFSYDSPGSTQAENYIQTVPKSKGMLPPVVDIEFYGDKEQNLPDQITTRQELTILLQKLEVHYEQRPILYATQKSYRIYLSGAFIEYDIWIRDVITFPRLPDSRSWTFWQYTDHQRLKGYAGKESFIDMNVFAGTREEFEVYGEPPS